MKFLERNWLVLVMWSVSALFFGWKAIYLFPIFLLVVNLFAVLVFSGFAFSILDVRMDLVRKGLVAKDSWFLKLLCFLRLHTSDPDCVFIWQARRSANDWLSYAVRAGEYRVGLGSCLSCGKNMPLGSLVKLDANEKLYWVELEEKHFDEFRQNQGNAAD